MLIMEKTTYPITPELKREIFFKQPLTFTIH